MLMTMIKLGKMSSAVSDLKTTSMQMSKEFTSNY
jgi:hypothetical protein